MQYDTTRHNTILYITTLWPCRSGKLKGEKEKKGLGAEKGYDMIPIPTSYILCTAKKKRSHFVILNARRRYRMYVCMSIPTYLMP